MNIRHLLKVLIHLGILLCISLSSCEDRYEWETFESIDLETEGIDLRRSDSDSFTLEGSVPPSGATFSFSGTGKYADVALISEVSVNGIPQEKEGEFDGEPPYLEKYPVLSGDWGKVEYKTDKAPYVIGVVIAPNDTGNVRTFDFTVGYGYKYTVVHVVQMSRSR